MQMQWFVNDLSLDGQFATLDDFRDAIGPLLSLRMKEPYLRQHLYCSRTLSQRWVTYDHTFQQAVCVMADKDFKRLVLSWITKNGPFWDDERCYNPDDYFEFQTIDVTDQGLGEVARRCVAGMNAGTYSFTASRFDFEKSPLQVQQGLAEEPIGWLDIPNVWNIDGLKQEIENVRPEVQNWNETIDYVLHNYPGIVLSKKHIVAQLNPYPFSQYVATRIFELLRVLNTIVEETNDDGGLSDKGIQVLDNHFVGDKAWFTDESPTNKNQYQKELKFPDPEAPENQLFCSWHGKIKTPQFRIHFEWSRPPGQKKIKVVYIGPKITKQ